MASNIPAWLQHLKVVYAELGRKPRRWGVAYYIKFNRADVPQLANAKKVRLIITRPDFAVPPFAVEARLHQES